MDTADLIRAAQEGRPRERHDLVRRYLPLIGGVARRYQGLAGIEQRELVQEGVVGLLRALERFDCDVGTPFWFYAAWWVRQAMQRLVSELGASVVLSDRAFRQLSRLKAAEREHLQEHGRHPSTRELATLAELPVEQIHSLRAAEHRPRGLDEPVLGEGSSSTPLSETVADPRSEDGYERVHGHVTAERLPGMLEALDARERRVLRGRYGLDGREQSLRELGGELGVSAERVRQIESASLDKLRGAAGVA